MCNRGVVRTTLDSDDDVLQAVKEIAANRGATTGQVLSDMARRALAPTGRRTVRNGVPLLGRGPRGSKKPTMRLVNQLRDEP
jgi:hypothetical protein